MTAHLALIVAHTLCGLLAAAAGALALTRPGWITTYRWAFTGLVISLAGAIAVGWAALGPVERVLFPGLLILGAYCVVRAVRAPPADADPTTCTDAVRAGRYLDHIGFGLISLFVGFVAIGVLDLGAPGWAAGVVAVGAAGLGPRVLAAVKDRRLRARWPARAAAPVTARPS